MKIWPKLHWKLKLCWITAIALRNVDLWSCLFRRLVFATYVGKVLQEICFLMISSLKIVLMSVTSPFTQYILLRYVRLLQHFLAFGPNFRAPCFIYKKAISVWKKRPEKWFLCHQYENKWFSPLSPKVSIYPIKGKGKNGCLVKGKSHMFVLLTFSNVILFHWNFLFKSSRRIFVL